MTKSILSSTTNVLTIPPTTRLGHVHLTVASLDRQIEFYTQVLNLKLHWLKALEAALGTEAEVLLRLTEDPVARRVQNTTGLYHLPSFIPAALSGRAPLHGYLRDAIRIRLPTTAFP